MVEESRAILALAALGHDLRLRLWRLLLPCGATGMSAGAIATALSVVPSSLSFHLRQMTQAGLLVQRRSSRQIIYSVDAEIVQRLNGLFLTLLTVESPPLSRQADDFISKGQG